MVYATHTATDSSSMVTVGAPSTQGLLKYTRRTRGHNCSGPHGIVRRARTAMGWNAPMHPAGGVVARRRREGHGRRGPARDDAPRPPCSRTPDDSCHEAAPWRGRHPAYETANNATAFNAITERRSQGPRGRHIKITSYAVRELHTSFKYALPRIAEDVISLIKSDYKLGLRWPTAMAARPPGS